jgi:hypothetical protein
MDRKNHTSSFLPGAGAYALLRFNGTAVYFMTYGRTPSEPDRYEVTIDGENESQSLLIGPNDNPSQFIAYKRTGMDASREHTIKITNPNNTDVNIDAFMWVSDPWCYLLLMVYVLRPVSQSPTAAQLHRHPTPSNQMSSPNVLRLGPLQPLWAYSSVFWEVLESTSCSGRGANAVH